MRFHKDKAGHWLPIIVQGDPSQPRAKPSVSVMDIKPGQSTTNEKTRRAKKSTLPGAGLRIEEAEVGASNNLAAPRGSSSRRPVSPSSSSSSSPAVVNNVAGVMPLPNLDKAEDDSNLAPEEAEVDDDQNPDGQVNIITKVQSIVQDLISHIFVPRLVKQLTWINRITSSIMKMVVRMTKSKLVTTFSMVSAMKMREKRNLKISKKV